MARIYPRPGKKGTIWYLDYAVDGRRVRKRVGRSKRIAELALSDIQVKLERQELGFAASNKTLDDLIHHYLDYSKSHNTAWSHDRALRAIESFKDFLKTNDLKAITPVKVEAYKSWRRQSGAVASTVNRDLTVIKAMFNRAVHLGLIQKNPVLQVKKFKEPKRQVQFFTQEEVRKILEAADGTFRNMVVLFLNTGLRRDELLHLAWEDIDLDRKILAVQAKEGWQPKDYEVRHIPLSAQALKALRELLGARGTGQRWVFQNGRGEPMPPIPVTHRFKALLRETGMEKGHLHMLRHTFASRLAMKGVDLYTISKLLGHSSIKTTEIYAHLAPDYLKSAVDKLDF